MKICILYSGGLDSRIMYEYAVSTFPDATIHCLYYDIGQPYAKKEIACLPDFVEVRHVEWLQGEGAVGKEGSSSGSIYIPGRNGVLATLAACQTLADEIWLGALLGENHEGATDKNDAFRERASELLSYMLKPFMNGKRVLVRFPLVELGFNKLDAVKWFLQNYEKGCEAAWNVLEDTSSCLSGKGHRCGQCVVCFRRWCISYQLRKTHQLNRPEEQDVHPIENISIDNAEMVIKMLSNDPYYDEHRCAEIVPAIYEYFEKEKGMSSADEIIKWLERTIRRQQTHYYFVTGTLQGLGKAFVNSLNSLDNACTLEVNHLKYMSKRDLKEATPSALFGKSDNSLITQAKENQIRITIINNGKKNQNEVFETCLELFKDCPNVTIVNIGSTSDQRTDNTDIDWMLYAADKNRLRFLSESAFKSDFVKCRILYVRVGLMDTPSTEHKTASNKIDPADVAAAVIRELDKDTTNDWKLELLRKPEETGESND